MAKLSIKQFSDWLGYDPETVSSAIEIVRMSDSDGAYTHAQDMGEDEIAEVIELIYFEHGSLKDAIQACKEDLGLIEESAKPINEISSDTFKSVAKKSDERGGSKQSIRLNKLYFRNFIGKELLGGTINDIHLFTDINELAIEIKMEGSGETKTYYYVIDEDHFGINEPIDRKSANLLSKIILIVNPDSKYKNVGGNFKLNESVKTQKIKLSEVRQLVRGILKEEKSKKNIIKESINDQIVDELKNAKDLEEVDKILDNYTLSKGDLMKIAYNGNTRNIDSALPMEYWKKLEQYGGNYYFVMDYQSNTFGKLVHLGEKILGIETNWEDKLSINESTKHKTQKIKLSEVRQLVRGMLKHLA